MLLNKRTLSFALFFLLVIFSAFAFAQTGFHKLPAGKMAIGVGYQRYGPPKYPEAPAPFRFNTQTILGNLDYMFSRDLKVSLLPGISFFQTNTQNSYEIAPSPSIDIRLLNINDMNMTGLKFFISGGFRAQYTNLVRNGVVPLQAVNMALQGGAGFLYLLETDYEWSLKPFFGMFYTRAWNNVSATEDSIYTYYNINSARNFFSGEAGLEIEMSPTMNVIGSIEFSFQSSELLYRFGLNFHQAPALNN